MLKLTAWSDRRLTTRRDALDLQTIIGWYGAGVLLDELYDTELALPEQHDFDPDWLLRTVWGDTWRNCWRQYRRGARHAQ